MTFTEPEVRRIIGEKVDIAAKYEGIHKHDGEWCLGLELDDDDSEELAGEKMAYYANFVADIERNKIIDEQLRQMMKICGVNK